MPDTYSVIDRETGRILGTDLTLTGATSLRDALTTMGDPYITPQQIGDREDGTRTA